MKDSLTHIRFILDRSGSMQSIRESTIAGFNEFIAAQKKVPGECTMTLQLFDTTDPIAIVFGDRPIADVPPLTPETYIPGAATPLHDAIGYAIDGLGKTLEVMAEPERPAKIIVAIMTDGLENSSRHYGAAQIAQKIELQRKSYKWEFLFLGANQDACMTGEALKIPLQNAMTYAATAAGTGSAMASTAANVASYRVSGQSAALAYTDAQRKEADEEAQNQ